MAEVKVYLFGSIGNGRDNEWALKAIKHSAEEAGAEILTPHVADWKLAMEKREKLGWKGLKDYDFMQLANSTCGIGDVSSPSTGVGRELERLLNVHKVPVLALRAAGKLPGAYHSALIDGEDSPLFHLDIYGDSTKIDYSVKTFIENLKTGKVL